VIPFFIRALWWIWRTLSVLILKISAMSSVVNREAMSVSPNSLRKTTWLFRDVSACHSQLRSGVRPFWVVMPLE
jgi:hypothetical protein